MSSSSNYRQSRDHSFIHQFPVRGSMRRALLLLLFGCLVHVHAYGPPITFSELVYDDGECPRGMQLRAINDTQYCVYTLFHRHLNFDEHALNKSILLAETFFQLVGPLPPHARHHVLHEHFVHVLDAGIVYFLFKPKSDECNTFQCFEGFYPVIRWFCDKICLGIESSAHMLDYFLEPLQNNPEFISNSLPDSVLLPISGCRMMINCSLLALDLFDSEDRDNEYEHPENAVIHSLVKQARKTGVMNEYTGIYNGGNYIEVNGTSKFIARNVIQSYDIRGEIYLQGNMYKNKSRFCIKYLDFLGAGFVVPYVLMCGASENITDAILFRTTMLDVPPSDEFKDFAMKREGREHGIIRTPAFYCPDPDAVAPEHVDGVFDIKIGCGYKRFTLRKFNSSSVVDPDDLIPFDYDYSWRVMLAKMPGTFKVDKSGDPYRVCVMITAVDDGYNVNGKFVFKGMYNVWKMSTAGEPGRMAVADTLKHLTYIRPYEGDEYNCIVPYKG